MTEVLHINQHLLKNSSESNKSKLITNICSHIALFTVFLYYPFQHLYLYHVSIENIPRFMDGIYGGFSAFIIIIFIYLILIGSSKKTNETSVLIIIAFSLFIFYTFSWALVHYLFAYNVLGSSFFFLYYSRRLLDYVLLFGVGFYLRPDKWRIIFIISFVLIIVNAIVYADWERMLIFQRDLVVPELSGVYLTLSTTALFSGFLTWAVVKKTYIRLSVLIIMVPLMMIAGGRGSFIAFLIVLPIAFWLSWNVRFNIKTFLFIVLSAVPLSILAIKNWHIVQNARIFAIFRPDSGTTSHITRMDQLSFGMERLFASPILGDYGRGGVLSESFSYIHNLLSVWQSFGIIPFLIFIILAILMVYFAINLIIIGGKRLDNYTQFIVIISLLATIEILFFKSLGWPHIALVWGMIAGWCHYRKIDITKITKSNSY